MKRLRGFSLLEVLVAFMFLALVGTALYRVFSSALQNVAAAEEYTRALLIAESRLAALGFEKGLAAGSESGEVEGDKYRWTVAIRPYAPPEGAAGAGPSAGPLPVLGAKLVEAEITVSWPGPRDSSRQFVLNTLRLAPGD